MTAALPVPPPDAPILRAYKLLTLRKDGSLGPLFIHCRQRIGCGVWLPAESHPTKGFALRPGWHVSPQPQAPHLSGKGRVWCEVEIADYHLLKRPLCQGGIWYIANWMRVLHRLNVQTPSNQLHFFP